MTALPKPERSSTTGAPISEQVSRYAATSSRQKPAGAVSKHWINSKSSPTKVIVEGSDSNRKELPVFTLTALHPVFVTIAEFPYILTGGRVSSLSFFAFPTDWEDVFPSPEKAAEESDFCLCG